MKKLSIEEVNKLEVFQAKTHDAFNELSQLEIGEGLFVAHAEWRLATPIAGIIGSSWSKKLNKTFKTKKVETGTYIIRIT